MHAAWWTSALTRQEKLPKLETLLIAKRRARPERQTVEQQRQVLHMLSQTYGVPLRRTRLIRTDA